jgi:hypothetical protein
MFGIFRIDVIDGRAWHMASDGIAGFMPPRSTCVAISLGHNKWKTALQPAGVKAHQAHEPTQARDGQHDEPLLAAQAIEPLPGLTRQVVRTVPNRFKKRFHFTSPDCGKLLTNLRHANAAWAAGDGWVGLGQHCGLQRLAAGVSPLTADPDSLGRGDRCQKFGLLGWRGLSDCA